MGVEVADLNKLKVAELKEQLKELNLPMTGNKAELVDRLKGALDAKEADTPATAVEEQLDVPHVPAAVTEEPAAEKPAAAVAATGTCRHPGIPVPAKPAAATASAPAAGEAQSDADKKKARAERFGIPLGEQERKQLRADRFGTAAPAAASQQNGANGAAAKQGGGGGGKPRAAETPEEAAKRLERAKRFGLPTKEGDEAKKEERAKRFGIATPAEEAKKKEERAKRFGGGAQAAGATATKADPIKRAPVDADFEAKKKARAERFAVAAK